ncbi:ABHD11 [Symbiodinium pilosum]|uniref:ABHD11 protein n=1 Tax=Symbiodinium pilosum TaxID=2952 RepID=A0A812W4D0_SYMPI|nr:ABHD11 [Symbiodinium pilosum]
MLALRAARCGNSALPAARGFAVLSHTWTGGQRPDVGEPQKVCVMMHGILGSKSNWNTPSRRLLQQIGPQGWRILQVDHRGHGRSPSGSAPHTLEACKDDVLETLQAVGISEAELVLCGHSFGGKVALAVLRALLAKGRPPKYTWIFDSVPGQPAEASEEEERRMQSVNFVLRAVASAASRRFESRSDLVDILQAEYGLTKPVAEWIAQSVRQSSDGVELSYDMGAVCELYDAYRRTDKWDLLQAGNAVSWRNTDDRSMQSVLDVKKALEPVVVDLPVPQQRLTLLRTGKRLEPDSQQLAAFGLKDGDELAEEAGLVTQYPTKCVAKTAYRMKLEPQENQGSTCLSGLMTNQMPGRGLLAPMSREEFLKHCWAAKAALRSVGVDAAAALGLRAANAALYFRASEELETRELGRLLFGVYDVAAKVLQQWAPVAQREALGIFWLAGSAAAWVRAQPGCTQAEPGWHTDFQHNFTFQLKGAKRWRFKAGPVKNNVRALTPHFQTRSNFEQQMKLHLLSDPTSTDYQPPDEFFADAEEVVLHEGAVLYHPAGIWHHVECLGDESISINVSLSCATWADLVGDAVRQLCWGSASLRQPLVGLDSGEPSTMRNLVNQRLKEAKRYFNALTAEDLLPTAMLDLPRLPSRIHLGKSTLGSNLSVAQSDRLCFGQLSSLVELADADSEDEDVAKSAKHYALHINFGNEDAASWLRLVLVAPRALHGAVAWLGQRQMASRRSRAIFSKTFQAKELLASSKASWTQVSRLIRVLRHCGYIYLKQ